MEEDLMLRFPRKTKRERERGVQSKMVRQRNKKLTPGGVGNKKTNILDEVKLSSGN